jgi:hypothetical protein
MLNRLKQKRMQVANSLAGRMKSERHLVQSVEVDRVLIDHASFRLMAPECQSFLDNVVARDGDI